MKSRKTSVISTIVLLGMFFPQKGIAKSERDLEKEDLKGWYVGVETGFPFAVSTFTSFGIDKTRFGWNIIPYVGYRFNPILSLEGQALWGKEHLSSRKEQADYLLNELYYSDLQSDVFTQRYTAQLNINLLGFSQQLRYSRWLLEVSPSISVIGTQAEIRTIKNEYNLYKDNTNWHFGVGANLESSYRITKNFIVGLYTNIHFLTGKQLDGIPTDGYKSNYIWDIGLNIGWAFGQRH